MTRARYGYELVDGLVELAKPKPRKNPNSSLQFEIAKQARIERDMEGHKYREPVCTCHNEGEILTIDGEKFLCMKRVPDAGCRKHLPCQSRYIPQPAFVSDSPVRSNKRNTAHSEGKGE